jgi:diguanylate cyclase (GGDEF)-like protein/PAS domain S-box-containing protein
MNLLSPRMLETCLNNMQDLMLWIGNDGRILHATRSALNFYGYDQETITGLTVHDLDCHFKPDGWQQHWESLKRNRMLTVTVQHRNKAGVFLPVEIVDNYQHIDGHEFSIAIIRSIAHREDQSQRMQLMEFSVDQMLDSALWIAHDGRITFVNDATCRNLGYSHDELVKMSIYKIDPELTKEKWRRHWKKVQELGSQTFESALQHKDGRSIPVEINSNLVQGYQQEYNCVFIRDISERKTFEARLTKMATHDDLTGLPNRNLFYDRISQALLQARRDRHSVGIMVIDLDRFKFINDNYGHDAGDSTLKEIATRVKTVLRASDTVCRLGGDEFVVVLNHIIKPEECARVGEKLLQAINKPVFYGQQKLEPGASIGIAIAPEDGEEAEALIKRADIAMYHAKNTGGGTFQFFKYGMGEGVTRDNLCK